MLLASGAGAQLAAAGEAEVILPLGEGQSQILLGPDDTLELVLKPAGEADAAPELRAWVLGGEEANPAFEKPSGALAQVLPSPTRPGEWIVHLRGLKPPEKAQAGSWDLGLGWRAGGPANFKRFKGVLGFRSASPDVVLLIDGSGSMEVSDPERKRVEAARQFLIEGQRSGGIGRVAMVQFDDHVRVLLPLTSINDGTALAKGLEAISENGQTDIDGGVRKALEILKQSPEHNPGAIVLLTDGKQEPGEYKNAHRAAKDAGIPVHTIGLGRDADLKLLARIASETGGLTFEAKTGQDLLQLYAAIAGRIAGGRLVLAAPLSGGAARFPIDGSINSFSISAPGAGDGELTLTAPGGQPEKIRLAKQAFQYVQNPDDGAWEAAHSGNGADARLEISAATPLYPLFFRARPAVDAPVEIDPDDPWVALSLGEGPRGTEAWKAAQVELTLERPGAPPLKIQLRPGDKNGVFSAALNGWAAHALPLETSGTLTAIVTGTRTAGDVFRRELHATWKLQRSGMRALSAPEQIDFGAAWSGASQAQAFSVKVRGQGGKLSASLSAIAPAKDVFGQAVQIRLEQVPASLANRGAGEVKLRLDLPEGLAPGVYSGALKLTLGPPEGSTLPEVSKTVTWRVEVKRPELIVTPRMLNLGERKIGDTPTLKVHLATRGGTTKLYAPDLRQPAPLLSGFAWPERLRLARPSEAVLALDERGVDVELLFSVASTARPGWLEGRVDFFARSPGGPSAALPLYGRVALAGLQGGGDLDFGALEPGDAVEKPWVATLAGPGWPERAAAPRYVALSAAPDRAVVALDGKTARLTVNAYAAAGALSGELEASAGPALLRGAWKANVIPPVLAPTATALDFGGLLPGQSATRSLRVKFTGARPLPLTTRLAASFAKPTVPGIQLPDAALHFDLSRAELAPGAEAELTLALKVPESAQDGLYRASFEVASRAGPLSITLEVNVLSPVPLPAFHVTPTSVELNVKDYQPGPAQRVHVRSHSDGELTLKVHAEPGAGYARPGALSGERADGDFAIDRDVVLPPRSEIVVWVRADPDAQNEETARIVFEAVGEKQTVEAGITQERTALGTLHAKKLAGISYLDWLRLLLLLAIILLVLLMRMLFKERWVRFTTYAVGIHVAALLVALPPQTIIGGGPPSIDMELLDPEELLGPQLTEEQKERLQELQEKVAATPDAAPHSPAQGALGAAPEPKLQQPGEQNAGAAAKAEAAGMKGGEDAPKPQDLKTERSEAAAAADTALAPDAPAPEPPQKPEQNSEPSPQVRDVAYTPARPAPASPELAPVPDAAPAPQRTPAPAPKIATPSEKAPQTIAPAATRPDPTAEPLATEDRPLAIEPTPASKSSTASETPVSAQATPAPANVTLTSPTGGTGTALNVRPSATVGAAGPGGSGQSQVATAKVSGSFGIERGPAASGTLGKTERPSGGAGNDGDPALDAGGGAPVAGKGNGTGTGTGTTPGNGARTTPAGTGSGTGTGLGSNIAGNGFGPTPGTGIGASGNAGPAARGAGLNPYNGSGGSVAAPGGNGNGLGASTARGTGNGTGNAPGDGPLSAGPPGPAVGTGTGTKPGPGAGTGNGTGERGTPAGLGGTGTGLGATGIGPGGGGFANGLPGLGTADGAGSAGTSAKPASLAGLGNSLTKETMRAPGLPQRSFGERGLPGEATSTNVKVVLGLAKHNGDWNSSPTAMPHLASALRERSGVPDLEVTSRTVALDDAKALAECRFVFITSNLPVKFTDAEMKTLRAYIEKGGLLWVNDSTSSDDKIFDPSFIAEAARLFPQNKLEHLEMTHPLFKFPYDLSKGYKGYRIPPGDKYREESVQAVMVPGANGPRIGLLYTRNDYADGLEIDPRTIAGMKSLTDLSPEEMLEGSVRFGLNVTGYALGVNAPRLPPPEESALQAAKLYRYNGPALKAFDDFERATNADGDPIWVAQDWGNPTTSAPAGKPGERTLRVKLEKGEKFKGAVARVFEVDLSQAKSIVLDLHSAFGQGVNVALLFNARGGEGYESRPVFVRPGWNKNLRFPLALDDFKSSLANWKEYDQPFNARAQTTRLMILIYNHSENGEVQLTNLRIEK